MHIKNSLNKKALWDYKWSKNIFWYWKRKLTEVNLRFQIKAKIKIIGSQIRDLIAKAENDSITRKWHKSSWILLLKLGSCFSQIKQNYKIISLKWQIKIAQRSSIKWWIKKKLLNLSLQTKSQTSRYESEVRSSKCLV